MNSEAMCGSSAYRDDQLVNCTRDRGHPSVHLGRLTFGDHTDELVQWTDADALRDDEPASEVPLWYGVLPIGQIVDVDTRQHPTVNGWVDELRGAVLDDHEQPSAIILGSGTGRVLIPWENVASMKWETES